MNGIKLQTYVGQDSFWHSHPTDNCSNSFHLIKEAIAYECYLTAL
ncbi:MULTISPECIES: hypothetical protein [Oscillatoriales]|nr:MULTISPECIES: hypothetical protein [Oscillatoriales]